MMELKTANLQHGALDGDAMVGMGVTGSAGYASTRQDSRASQVDHLRAGGMFDGACDSRSGLDATMKL